MNRLPQTLLLIVLCIISVYTTEAQQQRKKETTKETIPPPPPREATEKEVIPTPPPPRNENSDEEVLEALLTIQFDTTNVPEDALTGAIRELIEMTGAMNLGLQFAEEILSSLKGDAAKLPPGYLERLMDEMKNGQAFKWMVNTVIRAYRSRFTLEDVNQYLAFYKTPAGKKMVQHLPGIMEYCGREGQLIGRYIGVKVYVDMVQEGKIK